MMESGRYVYVDSHLVLNHSKYIDNSYGIGLCVAQVNHADFRHLLGHVKEIRKGDDEPLHYVCAAGTLWTNAV